MKGIFCSRTFTQEIDGKPHSVLSKLKYILPDKDIFCLDQVHSDHIVFVHELAPGEIPQADGIISRDPKNILCIRTADCLPVLLWALDSEVIGAVHAGWRGLAKGIVGKAIRLMRSLGACEIMVSLGPSIGPCCFEVRSDVIDVFNGSSLRSDNGSFFVDLQMAAFAQALEAGVDRHMIHAIRLCTWCNDELFFSYRRDGEFTGRNLSLIGGNSWLLPGLRAG